ncbi:MAG: molybdopterin-dependent oxidoreductase, partial [Acidimicrobiaceae bacterium]|nr:molybdopterin-dependent oxidoreductase [Acidimicrobiaceae bacterium]
TDALPYGQGTWGSRSAVMGGGAILRAAGAIRARVVEVAAALGHGVPWSGPIDPSVWTAVAAAAWWHPHLLPPTVGPGLTATAVYSPGGTGPTPDGGANHDETFGAHATALAVEVDPATGHVEVLAAMLVADCGTVINPAVVEGQLQGGFAQGWGAARFEEVRYRDDGQPLCASLLDYTLPTAADTPALEVVHRPTPSELAGGFRGVGEAGIIAAPAVLASAIEDALSPLGVRLSSTRLSDDAVRAAIEAAEVSPRW